MNKCLCSQFEFGTFEINSDDDYGTDCRQSTTRAFAQGHDAKLVGFVVRAELAGQEIRQNNGGVIHSFQGAVHAAGVVSEALAAKAQAQLDAARARVAKKAAREAAKAARKSGGAERKLAEAAGLVKKEILAKATPEVRWVKIKVGRWEFDAKIDAKTEVATYTSRKGELKSVQPGEYRVV